MAAIMIDPGHGGKELGAVANGLIEKDINLTVALKLREILQKCGFNVNMTRDADAAVSLDDRYGWTINWGADLFLSIHHNAGHGDGSEVIHDISGRGSDLARVITDEFERIGQNTRRIFAKELPEWPGHNYYAVIRGFEGTGCTPLILEFAFLDTDDAEIIDEIDEQYAEAKAIAKAVCRYYEAPFPEDVKRLYRVQVGAFRSRENAKRLAAELQQKGYPTIIKEE